MLQSMRRGFRGVVALGAILGLCIFSVSVGQSTLRFAVSAPDAGGFDPHLEIPGWDVVQNVPMFNTLTRFPPGTTDVSGIEPDLAERFESTDDGQRWVFHLRPGVQFHGGYGEVTSQDVKFSFERARSEELASPWRSQFVNIAEILTPDAYTVEVVLHEPDPLFLLNITGHSRGAILSKDAVEELGPAFRTNPIGTGPFRFVEYQPTQWVRLERFDNYFREDERALVDELEFHYASELSSMYIGLQRGDYHMAGGVDTKVFAERVEAFGLNTVTHGLGAFVLLFLNVNVEPFNDLEVRRAFQHAVDAEALTEALYGPSGEAAVSPVPIGYLGFTSDVPLYGYDPERAEQLLADAGYPDGLTITIQMSDHAVYEPPMVVLQDMLRASNIDLRLEIIEHSAYHQHIRQHLNAIVLYSALRPPDAGIWLREFFSEDTPSTNFANSPVASEFIRAAARTTDLEERAAQYAQAQVAIMEEAVAVPLYRRLSVIAMQPSVNPNYEILNTAIYYPEHLEFFSLEE